MKKLLFILMILLVFTLSSCIREEKELDYSDFPDNLITTFEEAETMSNNKYIVYYYFTYCSHCSSVKQEILNFFLDYDTLPYYIFNIADANHIDVSSLQEFEGTPTVFVMSGTDVLEKYQGADDIRNFISIYKDLNLDYSTFSTHHLTTYQQVLDIEENQYILYYYLDNCPHCNLVKEDFLEWAFTRNYSEIYFMNGSNVIQVTDPDNIPTELTILNSGTPILLVMSNGEFTDEYYSGSEDLIQYLFTIGDSSIIPSE